MEVPGKMADLSKVSSGLGAAWSLSGVIGRETGLHPGQVTRPSLSSGQFSVLNQPHRFPRQHTEKM